MGHWGSVTRNIGQVYENLKAGDGPNVPRFRQQKLSLSWKLDVLPKLDDELIEVEQADIIREKICLCIIDIDQALERACSHMVASGSVTLEGGSSAATPSVGGKTSGPLTTVTPTTTTTTGMDVAASTHTLSTVAAIPVLVPVTGSVITLMTTSAIVTATLSTLSTTPETGAATLVTPSSTPLLAAPHVKLPKLSIKKLGRDLTKRVTF